jgi:hypothetical protein
VLLSPIFALATGLDMDDFGMLFYYVMLFWMDGDRQ